jgi:hypothetical protein
VAYNPHSYYRVIYDLVIKEKVSIKDEKTIVIFISLTTLLIPLFFLGCEPEVRYIFSTQTITETKVVISVAPAYTTSTTTWLTETTTVTTEEPITVYITTTKTITITYTLGH